MLSQVALQISFSFLQLWQYVTQLSQCKGEPVFILWLFHAELLRYFPDLDLVGISISVCSRFTGCIM